MVNFNLRNILISLFLFGVPLSLIGQNPSTSIFINEFSLGDSSSPEFVELVVGNSSLNPSSNVNLEKVILDNDQDGDLWNAENKSNYLRFGSCFSSVPPGSIILIYDDTNPHSGINTNQDGLPNSEGIYQLPFSSSCLLKYSTPKDGKTYDDVPLSITDSEWENLMHVKSEGNALQLRKSSGSLVHALHWNDHQFVETEHRNTVQLLGVNGNTSSVYQDGNCDWTDVIIYSSQGTATPGEVNSTNNGTLIDDVSLGQVLLDVECSVVEHTQPGEGLGLAEVLVVGSYTPFTIEWNGASNGKETVNETGGHLITFLEEGHYDVVVTDAKGCLATCSFEMNVIEVIEQTASVCKGSCSFIGEVINSDFCHYWEPEQGLSNPELSQTDACPVESTVYFLTIIDGEGEIVKEIAYDIEVTSSSLTVTPENSSLCQPTTVDIEAESGFIDYVWIGKSGNIIGTERILTVSSPGEYKVQAKNTNGCIHEGIAIVESDLNIELTSGKELICDGEDITLSTDFEQGYSYQWYRDDISSEIPINEHEIQITEPGEYSVTVTSGTGCEDYESIAILDAEDPMDIALSMADDSSECIAITVTGIEGFSGGSGTRNSNGGVFIDDRANLLILFDGQEIAAEDLFLDHYQSCSDQGSIDIFITKNENHCEAGTTLGQSIFTEIETAFNNSTADLTIWVHIWDDPASTEDLMCIEYSTGLSVDCEEDEELLGPDWTPLTYDLLFSLAEQPLLDPLVDKYLLENPNVLYASPKPQPLYNRDFCCSLHTP